MSVSDITTFFTTSTRSGNDAANKIREKVLECICSPPAGFLEDPTHGPQWRIVKDAWDDAVARIASDTDIPPYTKTNIKMKGGRGHNYDADLSYYEGARCIATRKIEFKYGGSNVSELPQFLSLQAKMPLFPVTYDRFWYENYLDKYLECDPDITQAKPSLETYLKCVTSTKYSVLPFFQQLKDRESFNQKAKNDVVNQSITDYLTQYGRLINLELFSEKVKATQENKIYLLWSGGKFHVDKMPVEDMSGMSFHSIKNGNVLEIKSGSTIYGLLLRWRNHKGILNPAWQISLKRLI